MVLACLGCFSFAESARADQIPLAEKDSSEDRASETEGAPTGEPLPPVPVSELRRDPKTPSFDTALLLAACGVGEERLWEGTRFCLGGLVDVVFARKEETDPGVGAYLSVGSAGFRDVRASLGAAGIISLVEWFTLGARAGGLLRMDERGAAPGAQGFLELGHRSVSYKSHYALSHTLFFGADWVAPLQDSRQETTIWIGLRVDAVWLTAPRFLF